jgi:AcrR family transcriptional regulator
VQIQCQRYELDQVSDRGQSVVQVKKAEVREAIMEAAYKLFSDRGFNETTVNQIATKAGSSTANVYSYFGSKLEILYDIYDPWLRERLDQAEVQLAAIADPRKRLRKLIGVLWRDIPLEANGFANNIMQAISGASSEDQYDLSLLRWAEAKVGRMIQQTLPASRRDNFDSSTLAHIVFMAFDGFAMHAHASSNACCNEATIDLFCDLVLGPSTPRKKTIRRKPKPRT